MISYIPVPWVVILSVLAALDLAVAGIRGKPSALFRLALLVLWTTFSAWAILALTLAGGVTIFAFGLVRLTILLKEELDAAGFHGVKQ